MERPGDSPRTGRRPVSRAHRTPATRNRSCPALSGTRPRSAPARPVPVPALPFGPGAAPRAHPARGSTTRGRCTHRALRRPRPTAGAPAHERPPGVRTAARRGTAGMTNRCSWNRRSRVTRPTPWWALERQRRSTSPAQDSPEELEALWRQTMARSRALLARDPADGGLGRSGRRGPAAALRAESSRRPSDRPRSTNRPASDGRTHPTDGLGRGDATPQPVVRRSPAGPAPRPQPCAAAKCFASRGEANSVPHTKRITGPYEAAAGRPVKYRPGTEDT